MIEKKQLHQMRWILFYIFIGLFTIVVVATFLVVFLGIGRPSEKEREILFYGFVVEIGASVFALFYSIFELKKIKEMKKSDFNNKTDIIYQMGQPTNNQLIEQINLAGLTNFFFSRDLYAKYRPNAPTIDRYINIAKKSMILVSVNLMTGLPFDGLIKIFETKLEDRLQPISVIISLLNPSKAELMAAMSLNLETDSKSLSENIRDTLMKFLNFKESLSSEAKNRLEIRVHNVIPFGSAILIDHKEEYGRIQIETKPYKMPIRKSFAFEIVPTKNIDFFITLCESYENLLKDGHQVNSDYFI